MTEAAEALMALASRLRAAGRADEAAQAYRQLLAIRPDLPDSWFNLALMERQCGRFEAALKAYDEALRRGVSGPEEAWLNRGVIHADDLGRPDLALADLEAALAVAPDWPPALLNLGNLHEDMGRRDEAAAAYARALAAAPGHPVALARAAGLARLTGPEDPVIADLRSAVDRPDLHPDDRAELGFALGRALDQVGAFDDAFAAYAAANAASRAADPERARYDRGAHERFIDSLIAAFPGPATPADGVEAGPIFICGLFRSGSTLIEQILSGHSRVTGGGELGLVPGLARAIAGYPLTMATAGPDAIAQLRGLYLGGLETARPGADVVTDKRPDNFLRIGLIKAMFPNARIVHTVRQPLDVILSNWFLHLDRSMAHALDLEDLAHWHGQYERLMAHWKALYPDILDLDYDALVLEPRPAVERLLAWCGLDWEEAVLDFHKAAAPVRTASVWQVREPLYRRSSGRWRNYERHLDGVRAALGTDSQG
ncbi:sulfotransferase [Brevundimonas sp.]|uniref:tetratricopeptide repeat-containing sulfotransferase family protein n=1 Tax=Brevundimonas sp. TaxID=1871086 RepID=UPI0012038457|nr:sulfotransferase [Brevundimonas sp.]TAJ60190.1 MAG: tetratricopeptide repeat protein [Brevundimonas sp.]